MSWSLKGLLICLGSSKMLSGNKPVMLVLGGPHTYTNGGLEGPSVKHWKNSLCHPAQTICQEILFLGEEDLTHIG
jgi:hypothetical protein